MDGLPLGLVKPIPSQLSLFLHPLLAQQLFADYETSPSDGTPEHAALESSAGFSYRRVLGALIYAYVVARPDIGYAITTLACFSDRPAKIHFDTSCRVAHYLRMTKSWGLHYWHPVVLPALSVGTFQPLARSRFAFVPAALAPDSPCWICGCCPRHRSQDSLIHHWYRFIVLRQPTRLQLQDSTYCVDQLHRSRIPGRYLCRQDCQVFALHPHRARLL